MSAPVSFGVIVTSRMDSLSAWTRTCRRAVELGYSAISVPDHMAEVGPFTALGAAATVAHGIRIGTLALNNELYSPAVIAREMATLSRLYSGGVDVGLGAGWLAEDAAAVGRRMESPGVRIGRLEEALVIIAALLESGRVDHQGEHYTATVADTAAFRTGAVRPRLVVGGGGDRILRVAARKADVVSINPDLRAGRHGREAYANATRARLADQVALVQHEFLNRPDRPILQLMINYVGVGDRRAEAERAFRARSGLGTATVADCPHVLFGDPDEVLTKVIGLHAAFGISEFVVRDGAMEQLAPVISALLP